MEVLLKPQKHKNLPLQNKIKKIVWVTSTLHTAGGGSRLLLEGVNYYRSLGIEVHIITWDFDKESLFDGQYSAQNIHVLTDNKPINNTKIVGRAWERFSSLFKLRKKIKEIDPDIVYNQGEYDCTFLYIVLMGTKYQYVSLIFGQMFQFHKDIAKYTLTFKKHLDEIRLSTAGYREMVPAKRPPTGFLDIAVAEVISFIRYYAVRGSKAIFVFSKQVQWEVSKVYEMPSTIAKGAFSQSLFSQKFIYPIEKYKDNPEQKILLSLCRLIQKKRVDLKIRAFHYLVTKGKIPNTKLLIGGKGEDMDSLVALTKSLQLEDKVIFIGYVPEKDVFPLTESCDVYLSLDVADFDISPYEALGVKRPVIWSLEMDRDEFLTNCPAVFAVEPNEVSVADAIEKALALDISKIDWTGVSTYTWENYFQTILSAAQTADN
jgi:glycosyltransferase involved in cell wall biosynthesis